jgi:hypothetical protein
VSEGVTEVLEGFGVHIFYCKLIIVISLGPRLKDVALRQA